MATIKPITIECPYCATELTVPLRVSTPYRAQQRAATVSLQIVPELTSIERHFDTHHRSDT